MHTCGFLHTSLWARPRKHPTPGGSGPGPSRLAPRVLATPGSGSNTIVLACVHTYAHTYTSTRSHPAPCTGPCPRQHIPSRGQEARLHPARLHLTTQGAAPYDLTSSSSSSITTAARCTTSCCPCAARRRADARHGPVGGVPCRACLESGAGAGSPSACTGTPAGVYDPGAKVSGEAIVDCQVSV
jgi:hypothetical protein